MAQHTATEDTGGFSGKLSTAAFALAAGIVLARSMTNEIIREPFDIIPGADALPRSPGAIVAVVLNLLSFVPPLLVLASLWLNREARLIRSWSHMTFGLLATWAMASTVWSSDGFLTAITSGGLLAAAMLGWTMAQTVQSWLRLRILAGLAVGLLLVLTAHSVVYRLIDAPAMREMWASNSETLLKQQGMQPGSFSATQFAKKLLAGELMGFYHSPNSLAAIAVLCLLVLIGSMLQRRTLRDRAGWLVPGLLILIPATWMIYATACRSAIITPVLGTAIIIAAGMAAGLTSRYRKLSFCTGILVICLAIAAVVGHGLTHGGLVERSLTFRWHYWTAALRIFRDHPLAGTGYDCFGLFYSAAKLPLAPEDVKDPHNLLVRFFAELGIVGGLLAVGWLLQSWWELTRPLRLDTAAVGISPETDAPASRIVQKILARSEVQHDPLHILSPIIWPAALATLIAIIANVDFSQPLILSAMDLMRRALYGCLLLAGGVLLALKSLQQPQLDDRPAPWLLRSILAGLAMFLLHNTIDFSFFEPGVMMLFMALTGAAIGVRAASSPSSSAELVQHSLNRPSADLAQPTQDHPTVAPMACAAMRWAIIPLGIAALAYGLAIAVPITLAESAASTGDESLRQGDFTAAAAAYRAAADVTVHLPNSDYPTREARALYFGRAPTSAQLDALGRAIAVAPHRAQAWSSRAELRAVLSPPDIPGALDDFEHATALDPNNVDLRLTYATWMERLAQWPRAISQYQEALQRNGALPADEIRRLSPAKVREIEAKLAALRAGHPPANSSQHPADAAPLGVSLTPDSCIA